MRTRIAEEDDPLFAGDYSDDDATTTPKSDPEALLGAGPDAWWHALAGRLVLLVHRAAGLLKRRFENATTRQPLEASTRRRGARAVLDRGAPYLI